MERRVDQVRRPAVPPPRALLDTFLSSLKETFFPDDPLRKIGKEEGRWRKFVAAVKYIFPIVDWASSYSFSFLKSDLISGITIASVAIPQGISYAKLANLPPIVGLYSNFVPPLVYAVMGSSKDIAVGNSATASLVMASMLEKEVTPLENPTLYLHLAFTAALFAGIFQTTLGLLRLGLIVDFLSHACIVGFMSGTATYVSIQQLKGILGLKHFTASNDIIHMFKSIFSQTHQWKWEPAVMGIFFIFVVLASRFISKKRADLFWVSAITPLTSVVVATLIVYLSHADKHNIEVVSPFFLCIKRTENINIYNQSILQIGYMKEGINPPSLHTMVFSKPLVMVAIKAGIVSGIIGLAEAMAVARIFAMAKNYKIDSNKEMTAFGVMNIAGSLTSCYITAGPFSRAAVNYSSGCKTAMSNVVMATLVLITLLFLMPLFHYTPSTVLSAIIIGAMLGLIDYKHALHLWHVDKTDFCVCIGAYLGVIFSSAETGLAIGVVLSVLRLLLFVARPRTSVLGNIPNSTIYLRMDQNPVARSIPGFLILRIDAPIYFANASYLRDRITRWIEEEEDKLESRAETNIHHVILDLGAVGAIDNCGVGMLEEVKKIMQKRGLIQLVLANPASEVMNKLHKSKVMDFIGREWIFLTVSDAVAACAAGGRNSESV
ncbi:sulfate transporter 3.1-like [Canna indica]|uniref:Sulfate transporter 3.1-like n=1 Tax=Canna indica TaxID=4628 RepID=A0AAQ3K734_9LILI|nr:sulfate transporter 3.1-like [Canna indica]